MKKILYLVTKSNWGGAQRYVYDLATHLPEGFEAVVAAGGDGLLMQKLREKGLGVIANVKALQIFRIIAREKPDVLHVNSSVFGGIGAFCGFIFNLLPNTYHLKPKIIFTAHGWPFNEDRNLFWKLIVYKLSWLTSLFSDITITITKSDYAQGKRIPFVSHKMRLIHNAIEQINFIDRDRARSDLGIQRSDLCIGTIAELTPNKGLKYLVEAMEKINAKLVIIGEGKEKIEPNNKTIMKGFVPDASRYLKAFDIFVLPSLKEGLPYVLIEAAQAGLPIVASNVGGIPDIIGNTGMLVPPKNPDLLARAIKATLANPKPIIYKQFPFPAFLSQTYELYK